MGAGQNTFFPITPALPTSAYHVAFTDGTPYTREPGPAARRSATSSWTITSPCRMLGKVSRMCSSTGTATLYGRLATSAVGCAPPGSSRTRAASACTTLSRGAASGKKRATVSGSCRASGGSISTAVTADDAASSPSVNDPSPGPTSRTCSSGVRCAAATMRRMVLGSITKF